MRVGDEASFTFDVDEGGAPKVGEVFESPGGSLYEVLDARRMDSSVVGRYAVHWLKLEPDSRMPDRVLFWHPR